MKKSILLLIFLLLTVGVITAQDDEWRGDGDLEYHCATVSSLSSAIADGDEGAVNDLATEAVARNDDEELTVEAYISRTVIALLQADPDAEISLDDLFSAAAEACGDEEASETETRTTSSGDTFNVIVSGNANLRSCAGTNCEVVGQVAAGDLLKVVKVEGEWYEVEYEDSTAFIANFLVTRGPDEVIDTDELFVDSRTGCRVAFDIKRGDANMTIIIAGDRRGEVLVDLYRPNENAPLRVEGQLDKTFIDTGDPYIHQYYRWNIGWPQGVYNLEIKLDDQTSKLAWEMAERGDYNVYILCD